MGCSRSRFGVAACSNRPTAHSGKQSAARIQNSIGQSNHGARSLSPLHFAPSCSSAECLTLKPWPNQDGIRFQTPEDWWTIVLGTDRFNQCARCAANCCDRSGQAANVSMDSCGVIVSPGTRQILRTMPWFAGGSIATRGRDLWRAKFAKSDRRTSISRTLIEFNVLRLGERGVELLIDAATLALNNQVNIMRTCFAKSVSLFPFRELTRICPSLSGAPNLRGV